MKWFTIFRNDDPASTKKPTGAELIAAERRRQVTQERWSPEHDDQHMRREMVQAARAYLHATEYRAGMMRCAKEPPVWWPWEWKFWKPSLDDRKNLIKAGALIAAEIDRLNRMESKSD